jgi:hypothetical protein
MAGGNNQNIKVGLKTAGMSASASDIAKVRESMSNTHMTISSAIAKSRVNKGSAMGAASRSTLGGAGAARGAEANAKFKAEQVKAQPAATPPPRAAPKKAAVPRKPRVEPEPGSMAARLLAPKGAPSAGSKAAVKHDASVLGAVHAAAARQPPGSLLGMRDVRGMQKLDKASFDAAALRLQSAGKIVLHHHDAPFHLSDAARAQLVRGSNGYHYEGIALRKGA